METFFKGGVGKRKCEGYWKMFRPRGEADQRLKHRWGNVPKEAEIWLSDMGSLPRN